MIVACPVSNPVTMPEAKPIVATEMVEVVHVPPVKESASGVGNLRQIFGPPVMGPGNGLTVTITVAGHPVVV